MEKISFFLWDHKTRLFSHENWMGQVSLKNSLIHTLGKSRAQQCWAYEDINNLKMLSSKVRKGWLISSTSWQNGSFLGMVCLAFKKIPISTKEESFVVDYCPDPFSPPKKEIMVCMHTIFEVQFLLRIQRIPALLDHPIKLATLDSDQKIILWAT